MAQPGVQLDGERELLLVPAHETSISLWPLAAICAVLLVVSFVVANAIAWWLQVRRERRIARKTATLAGATSADGGSVVPVTVLTGFLGAGKTTLLNRILHTPDVPFKVMVLENELGAISIDHTLLQAGKDADVQDQDAIVVLQNGCMCCMARGNRRGSELERIVDYLLRLVNEKGFDYLVVETSGLADPGPIIETFLRLRASRFRLDSIVAMVDARAAQRYYSPRKASYKFPVELQRQLLYADIVALNKVDLADREEVQRLHAGVAAINEEATVYECANAELNLSHIIGVDTFDAVKFREALSTADSAQIVAHGIHSDGVSTVHFEVVASVALPRFSEWLAQVVERYAKADILRIKGVLAVAGEDARCVVQCVLDTYTMAPSRAWGSQERRASKLVVIGQGLDREQLERGFRRCLVGVDGDDGDDNNEADAVESKKQR